jgi:hypothetical protein
MLTRSRGQGDKRQSNILKYHNQSLDVAIFAEITVLEAEVTVCPAPDRQQRHRGSFISPPTMLLAR